MSCVVPSSPNFPLSVAGSETPGLHPCGHGALRDCVTPLAAARGSSDASVQVQHWALSGMVRRQEQRCPEGGRDATSGVKTDCTCRAGAWAHSCRLIQPLLKGLLTAGTLSSHCIKLWDKKKRLGVGLWKKHFSLNKLDLSTNSRALSHSQFYS